MHNPIAEALLFLINSLFNAAIFILIIRLILVWVRANYFDPLTQFIIKGSDWLIKRTRRYVRNISDLETACLLWILVIEIIKLFLVSLLTFGFPNLLGIAILACGELLSFVTQIFIMAIIIQCVLSFIQPQSPISYILKQFVSPIMSPIQRYVPVMNGIDLSPIPAILLLQFY